MPKNHVRHVCLLAVCVLSLLVAPLSGIRQAGATTIPVRWGYYTGYAKPTSLASLKANIGAMTHVSPWYNFQVYGDGSIGGKDDAEVSGLVRSHGRKLVPMVQNDAARGAKLSPVLRDPVKRSSAISRITQLAVDNAYDGINLDFEGVSPEDRVYLSSFIAELHAKLHERGKLMTIAVPAKVSDSTTGWGGAYDYAAIAPYADLFVVMAYDYHWSTSGPGPVAPISSVKAAALYARAMFGAGKTVLGVATYGYDWNVTAGGKATSVINSRVHELVRTYGGTLSYDSASASARASYTSVGNRHDIWYEDARAVNAKLALVRELGVRGFAFWRLGAEDARSWSSVRGLQLGRTAPSLSPDGDGQRETLTLTYTLPAPTQQFYASIRDSQGRTVCDLVTGVAAPAGAGRITWDGRHQDGTPAQEGSYTGRISAWYNGVPVTDVVTFTIDNTLGRVATAPRFLAPSLGTLSGSYELSRGATSSVVVRKGTMRVRVLSWGALRPAGTHRFSWDGRDSLGVLVPEGEYAIYAYSSSEIGKTTARRMVYVDRTAPVLTNLSVTTSPSGRRWSYTVSEPVRVQLELARGGTVVRTVTAPLTGPGSASVLWDGTIDGAPAPAGTYSWTLVGTDLSGLRSAAKTGSFSVGR